MVYIKIQPLLLPTKGTSDHGDLQQIGHSDNQVLSSTLNAFMYVIAFCRTQHFNSWLRHIRYGYVLCSFDAKPHMKCTSYSNKSECRVKPHKTNVSIHKIHLELRLPFGVLLWFSIYLFFECKMLYAILKCSIL